MTKGFLKKFLPCSFTERASAEILNTIETKNIPDEYGLRVGIKGGGCSGIAYVLGFDKQTETDDMFEENGIKIFIEKKHAMYMAGVVIDFEDGINARGFIFNSPLNES